MSNDQQTTKGILYITYGSKYVSAAIRSAKTAREHNPGLLIHIFVDQQCFDDFGFAASTEPFTSASVITNPHRRSKVDFMAATPFEATLYLDSDTSVAEDITGMFNVLEKFDICAAHTQHRNSSQKEDAKQGFVPNAFSEFNTGVILYRSTPSVTAFLEQWSKVFEESGNRHDQPTFRALLWKSDLRIAVLPPEYNVRYIKYKYLWSRSEAIPMIYHQKKYHQDWRRRYLVGPFEFILRRFGIRWVTFRKKFQLKTWFPDKS